jgi:hypothetical protein
MSAPQEPSGARPRREDGSGRIYRAWYHDRATGERRQVQTWTLRYYVNGKVRKESTGLTDYGTALRQLKQRLAELRTGTYVGVDVERTTYLELERLFLLGYETNRRRSLDRMVDACDHLRRFFGPARARDITTDVVLPLRRPAPAGR